MKYDNILYKTAAMVLAAGVLLPVACEDDRETIPPTLDVTTGRTDVEADTLRLISYNILEGMKLDKADDFDNFVAWVREQDPDILALQEANKLSQEQLEAVANRYGHEYVVTNLKSDDNYPVALTSRYPIEVVQKITDKVSHGAIHARIKGIDIVVLHLWPQSYAPSEGFSGYSPTAADGDAYRLEEIERMLEQTIRRYPERRNWLMTGDFNSHSELDAAAHASARNYDVHNTILTSGYFDCLRYAHDYFIRSTPTAYGGWVEGAGTVGSRIDFVYGSKTLLPDITRSWIIQDAFTDAYSDHYPCLLEWRYYPEEL